VILEKDVMKNGASIMNMRYDVSDESKNIKELSYAL
jgi:hypothetical protein